MSLNSVPDPCPDIQPSTQVTDMCQAGLAIEQIGESQHGSGSVDHVTLRARTQEDNCTCLVFIENQSLNNYQIYMQPYQMLQSSAPQRAECGLELYLDFYQLDISQLDQNLHSIRCTSGQTVRLLALNRNSVLRFTSKLNSGNLTRGYCIDIQRVHVNGQNGTLKIVCDVPGLIPSIHYTTPQTLDQFTKSSIDQSTSPGFPVNHSDDSTVYLATGASAGIVVIACTVVAIMFCKR